MNSIRDKLITFYKNLSIPNEEFYKIDHHDLIKKFKNIFQQIQIENEQPKTQTEYVNIIQLFVDLLFGNFTKTDYTKVGKDSSIEIKGLLFNFKTIEFLGIPMIGSMNADYKDFIKILILILFLILTFNKREKIPMFIGFPYLIIFLPILVLKKKEETPVVQDNTENPDLEANDLIYIKTISVFLTISNICLVLYKNKNQKLLSLWFLIINFCLIFLILNFISHMIIILFLILSYIPYIKNYINNQNLIKFYKK